jgi:peptidoglycan/LPS O-acetylase OafA/YrhL
MNWPVTILLLAAAAVVAYMLMEQPVRKQMNMNMKRVRLPYRPLSDTGSNKAAPTSFDTKALCATAAEC